MIKKHLGGIRLCSGVLLLLALSGCKTLLTEPGQSKSAEGTASQLLTDNDGSLPAPLSAEGIDKDKNCNTSEAHIQAFSADDHAMLWDRVRAGYSLAPYSNARINTYLKWYARNPAYMARVSERAEKYMFHIAEKIEQYNMPMEIALLPIVESAFDPFAYSHGRASGMWQFVPSTGRQYGLKQNWWYDGRRDVVASTDAAMRFLTYLHRRFDGDWLLALAAYNSGEGNVSKAIRRNRAAGKATDFWSLNLPRETKAYVPQLLALSKIVMLPADYKVSLKSIPNQPWFTAVDISSQIDLAQAARLADMDIDQLYKINPGFNRWATDPDGPHRLLIPNEQSSLFIENLNALPTNERIGWKRYTIKSGDSLIRIARKFNTSVDALQSANNLNGHSIRQGKALMIPVATSPARHYSYSVDQRLKRTQNKSKGTHKQKVNYTVRSGDSFWKIARAHNVTVSKLTKWNGMAPGDPIKIGQKLVIWTGKKVTAQDIARNDKGTNNSIIRKLAYSVRRGDSLARIAGKFNLSVKDIMRWNTVNTDSYIHPGQSLTLFVDVTRTN